MSQFIIKENENAVSHNVWFIIGSVVGGFFLLIVIIIIRI